MTLLKWLKEEGWKIKGNDLKDMRINPRKEYGKVTLDELDSIASFLDVTISELVA